MSRRILCLFVPLLAAGLIAAGCGDDDEATTGATGASGATGATGGALETSDLSKSEWIEAADQICQQGDQEIDRQAQQMFGEQGGQPSEEQFSNFANDVLVPQVQDELDQIRELGAPEGDEDQVAAILAAAQQGVNEIEQDPSVLQGNGETPGFKKANQLARDYGLKVCGSD